MLKEIAIVTITVTNLGQVESAWQDQFDYRVADKGQVSEELADFWDADEMEGADYVIMQPANEAAVYIRFVEDDNVATYNYMTSHGWNATELLTRDTDAVAANMKDSAFDIIGEPKDLWPAPNAPRAMQAVGPGRELLYITTNANAAKALGLAEDMPLVERAFIMVLGGPSMYEFHAFYASTLGLKFDSPSPFRITTISKANGLDLETTYPLAIAHTAPGFFLELDELPESIGPREVADDHLPPGVAIVGFNSPGVTADVEWVTEPLPLEEFPYKGRKAGLIRGPAGELVEVILE